MRDSCRSCARKHIAQACILMLEAQKGYPEHGWLAVGHMAEAEDELLEKHPDMANVIRSERVEYMRWLEDETEEVHHVNCLDLIKHITDLPT